MKYTQTIKKNHLFRRLYHKGNSAVSPYFAVYTLKNSPNYRGQGGGKKGKNPQLSGLPESLLGVTVGTKLGNAVKRNRVRRRIMAIYRCHEEAFCQGHSVVIVARNRCATATYAQMEQSLLRLFAQLNLQKQGQGGDKEQGGKKQTNRQYSKRNPQSKEKSEKNKQVTPVSPHSQETQSPRQRGGEVENIPPGKKGEEGLSTVGNISEETR